MIHDPAPRELSQELDEAELPLKALGPFRPTRIEDIASFGFQTLDVVNPQGGTYLVDLESEVLRPLVTDAFEDCGRLSPSSPLSLPAERREAACVPKEATTFAFACARGGAGRAWERGLRGGCARGAVPAGARG